MNLNPEKKLRRLENFFKEKNLTQGRERLQDTTFYSFLNELVSQIDEEKECYLEVGVFVGTTLISAAKDNKAMCYGIDNFKTNCYGQSAEIILKENISKSELKNVKYFNSSFQDFFEKRKDIEDRKVKIYFYDGDHSNQGTYDGLERVMPLLCDEAYVLVHDTYGPTSKNAPRDATLEIIKNYKEFSLLKEIESSDEWPTGVMILKFIR